MISCFRFWIASLFICFSFAYSLQAQKAPFKVGVISAEEFNAPITGVDTTAAAIILYDYGSSYFTINAGAIIVHFERHTRIKILRPEGYSFADVEVPCFKDGSSREFVNGPKAFTHNLVDGNIVTEKLDKKGLFVEETSENWETTKFTLPNVKTGSIIDYTYTKTSPFFVSFQPWRFQSSVPTKRSEYYISIPIFFEYLKQYQGYTPFVVAEKGSGYLAIDGETTVTATDRWVQENVPAFKAEPFITTEEDYISKMEFQLASLKFPGRVAEDYLGTWSSMLSSLWSSNNFGEQLENPKRVAPLASEIVKDTGADTLAKAAAIYNYVTKNFKWNGQHSKHPTQSSKELLESKTGNSADLNILFAAMLRAIGVEADPVLISTRSHGRPSSTHPIATKFNSIITYAKIGNEELLMNPTDSLRPYTLLDYDDVNDSGIRMTNKKFYWMPLNAKSKSTTFIQLKAAMQEDGLLNGEATFSQDGHIGISSKKAIAQANGDSKAKNPLEDFGQGEGEISGLDDAYKPLTGTFKLLDQEAEVEVAGDRIYFNPLFHFRQEENPLKSETRVYPIDYGYADQYMYVLSLNLPEGYIVEEMPKPIMVSLPNKAGKFTYSISAANGALNLSVRLQVNETTFSAQDYGIVKEFFSQIVAKQAEQVVLKKAE